jgi:cytochrome oxidase Cu insertion factor (SCO1/SenC/PrrC family)
MGARTGIFRRDARLLTAVLIGAVALGVGVGVLIHVLSRTSSPSAPAAVVSSRNGLDGQATWAAGARVAPAITTLVDQTGHRFALSSLHGRMVALVFFDSHCKQQCPLEGRELAAAESSLPRAERPVLVAVSVNTLDTPASVRHAIRSWGLATVAPWHYLMGGHAQLAKVWHAYHIFVGPTVKGDVIHTEAVYLIDKRGYERSAYLFPFGQQRVAHDLRALA